MIISDPAQLQYFLSLRLPVVASQHDQCVARPDGSACRASQHLICHAHIAREVHVHIGFVLLDLAEAEVTEIVDRVV